MKREAEAFYREGSYARAYEIYAQAKNLQLPTAEARWVEFRMADTLWRSQAATETADTTKLEQARERLEVLVRDIKREEDRDRVWAEVQESLGDLYWTRRNNQNWSAAWPYYQAALDWWGGAREVDVARERYLAIVWKVAQPPQAEPYYYYGYYGNFVPLEILENALKIAKSEEDKARAHYLIAMTLRAQGGDWEQRERIPEEFEAALKMGRRSEWYDDALYYYAETLAGSGRAVLKDGEWRAEPDYVRALELFRRLVREFKKGETRYYDQAAEQINNIIKPTLGLGVGNVFLPDSEIQFYLNWRNTQRVDFALYRVDLNTDVQFKDQNQSSGNWLQNINVAGRETVRAWSKTTEGKAEYKPGAEWVRLPAKLGVGAYLLEARSGAEKVRDLILVTDVSVVLKSSGRQTLVYFCHAITGAPVAKAAVHVWEKHYTGQNWVWRATNGETNADGMAVFETTANDNGVELFVSANDDGRQAFATGNAYYSRNEEQSWKIYAFTDRPAYRPGESVQWKFIARQEKNGVYTTPSNKTVEYEIADPRGTKVKEGKATLNSFGSAWGGVELTEQMPLGEYRVTFYDAGRRNTIGDAVLFRLEEYKLPEFKVSVQTPEENGRKKAFRLGEKVEVNVTAEYYYGGPVANATVEVLVYQNPFYQIYRPRRDYAWFYEDLDQRYRYYGQGPIIKRETIKTDAQGKAVLTFDTPRGGGQDFEYRVEARVTDSSRREIVTSGSVRVTRQRYYVYQEPEHNIYRPQDKVKVNIKALDANDQPVQTEGQVKVTRDYWYEIWIDPQGREVKGDALKVLRERNHLFPPAGWRLKFSGYLHEDIATQPVKTDAEGAAQYAFTPEREGFYRVEWTSADKYTQIKAETMVWVATNATTDLGYRHGGLEIIVDKDTFRAGQTAPVMLTAPTSDAYVLFSVEGEDLYSYQLVHLTGNTKLLQLPVEEKYVPNIFLGAAMVSDRQIYTDTKQVVIPPVEHFLQVDVKADRTQYQPRDQGTFTVTTRDYNGRPVSAEVALALVDESVFYIQQDMSGDPRQFYYGNKRQQRVQTVSSFQQKPYVRLVEDAQKNLSDDKNTRRDGEANELKKDEEAKEAVSDGVASKVSDLPYTGRGRDPFARPKSRAVAKASLGAANMEAQMSRADAPAAPPAQMAAPQEPAVVVRSDFRSTVLWQPDVITDSNGTATVKVKYPDSLTGWKASARVASTGSQFGMASTSTRTKQPLIVRLQAPRFFLTGDTVTVSAVINNNTDQALTVTPTLDAEGVTITGLVRDGREVKGEVGPLKVEANGETRADWLVTVQQPGTAKLKVTARGGEYADAMEKSYLVYEHGIEKLLAKSGKVRGNDVTVKLDLPKERKRESTMLAVQITPSMAVTMLDALPYLIDYPYGCTEQTMSRFLPAAITAKTLRELGMKPEDAMNKIFGGIEQSSADATHPTGKKDLRQLDDITRRSLDRLYDFQHADGGWGWWKEGESDHYMTAYVVWGFVLARDARIQIKEDALTRGVSYLDKEIVEEEASPDEQAWMLHALAIYHASVKENGISKFQRTAFDNLFKNRDRLNAYTRALLALSAHYYGDTERANVLVRNLENGVKRDTAPDTSVIISSQQTSDPSVMGTAHWGEDGIYWRWSEGGVEATAFVLRALLAIDPQNKLIEPVTNWLIKNRRGAQWSNTRDTAITVLTLNDYLRKSGELASNMQYELSVNGSTVATKSVSAADILNAPSKFTIDRNLIRDGANEIRIRRTSGNGPVYFAAEARFFSLEEPITPAGSEIFVRRDYYKLVGRPTLLKGYVYDRQPLRDGESVKSGERVEVVLTIEGKNNYEYLLFEDLKPAGLEAVQIRSGEMLYANELKSGGVNRKVGTQRNGATATDAAKIMWPTPNADGDFTGRTRWVYQELRDRKVALFIDKLPEGVWQIKYDLRAEVPGKFHALPVMGQAMYVPEIRANGAELRVNVVE